jgi:hypothetical protein
MVAGDKENALLHMPLGYACSDKCGTATNSGRLLRFKIGEPFVYPGVRRLG